MKLGHTYVYAETNNGKTYDDCLIDGGVFYTKLSKLKTKKGRINNVRRLFHDDTITSFTIQQAWSE